MKIFVDSADVKEIEELAGTGLIDGVTTNPSLIARSGQDFFAVIKEICQIIKGPVSAEVISLQTEEMLKEAEKLSKIASNVVIKLPLTMDGLKACKVLSEQGIKTNVTLCFSANQALLAAKAGASFVSPFVGRLDDIGYDGMNLINDIVNIYHNYSFKTEVLAASIRNTQHIYQAAMIGAHAATVPAKIIKQLADHHLTDSGIKMFLKDWDNAKQRIQ